MNTNYKRITKKGITNTTNYNTDKRTISFGSGSSNHLSRATTTHKHNKTIRTNTFTNNGHVKKTSVVHSRDIVFHDTKKLGNTPFVKTHKPHYQSVRTNNGFLLRGNFSIYVFLIGLILYLIGEFL